MDDKTRELVLAARSSVTAWQDVEEEPTDDGYVLVSEEDLATFTATLDALTDALEPFAQVKP